MGKLSLKANHYFMRAVLATCVGVLCLAAQQPTPSPTLAVIDAYVCQIDATKTLTTKRHIHTYRYTNESVPDSLFWVYGTDFPCSVTVYFSGNKIVKLVETARASSSFSEYSYYIQNSKLLCVKNRQVSCPFRSQIAAWRSHTLPYTKAADSFFWGTYYFVQASCIVKRERGESRWSPRYDIPGRGGQRAIVPAIFPLQAARYSVVFEKAPAKK